MPMIFADVPSLSGPIQLGAKWDVAVPSGRGRSTYCRPVVGHARIGWCTTNRTSHEYGVSVHLRVSTSPGIAGEAFACRVIRVDQRILVVIFQQVADFNAIQDPIRKDIWYAVEPAVVRHVRAGKGSSRIWRHVRICGVNHQSVVKGTSARWYDGGHGFHPAEFGVGVEHGSHVVAVCLVVIKSSLVGSWHEEQAAVLNRYIVQSDLDDYGVVRCE